MATKIAFGFTRHGGLWSQVEKRKPTDESKLLSYIRGGLPMTGFTVVSMCSWNPKCVEVICRVKYMMGRLTKNIP